MPRLRFGLISYQQSGHDVRGRLDGVAAVVAPVTAGYGAVTTLLSSIAGEHFTLWVSSGIALTILSSLTSAITVMLARLINHDRLASHQWIAIAFVIFGLWLMKQ